MSTSLRTAEDSSLALSTMAFLEVNSTISLLTHSISFLISSDLFCCASYSATFWVKKSSCPDNMANSSSSFFSSDWMRDNSCCNASLRAESSASLDKCSLRRVICSFACVILYLEHWTKCTQTKKLVRIREWFKQLGAHQ